MKFNYQARTQEGQVQSGVVEASSQEAAIALLQRQGFYVTVLEKAALPPIYARRIKFFERISRKDIVMFSRQLSIMFKSKIPLVESLGILGFQARNLDFKEKILRLSEEVEGGSAFSAALAHFPEVFSSFYIAMVRAGEASGKLSESLGYLAEHLEKQYHLQSRLRGAMVYPALIIAFVIIVLILMIFFVIPHLTEILEETGQEMPTITAMVIALTDFLRESSWVLVFIMGGSLFFSLRYYRTKKGRKFFEKASLKLPQVGSCLKMIYISRFAENLSTLISGGLPIGQALEITASIVGNSIYKEIILEARDRVRKGEPISNVLAQFPEVFPPMFCQMTLVGEKTGTLDKTLMEVVNFYQKETERTINELLSVLEPLLIMFLGLIVGGLMFSILMPLYQMVVF